MTSAVSSIFGGYLDAVSSMKSTEIIEGPSPSNPARVNVFVQAGSFESCQALVTTVMEREGIATFTIPTLAANGCYVAYGHYPRRQHLPEL